jgi:hypothetical protein
MDKGEGERGADGLPHGNISISVLPIDLGLGFETEKPVQILFFLFYLVFLLKPLTVRLDLDFAILKNAI